MHTPLCLSTSSPRPLPFGQHTHTHTPPTHLPQIKDRHNGNILIDDQGCLVHIDFGFMLSNSPGGVNFEAAPFKLTREMLEVMDSNSDGKPSEMFDYFKVRLFVYACVGTVVMCMWCLCVCVCACGVFGVFGMFVRAPASKRSCAAVQFGLPCPPQHAPFLCKHTDGVLVRTCSMQCVSLRVQPHSCAGAGHPRLPGLSQAPRPAAADGAHDEPQRLPLL